MENQLRKWTPRQPSLELQRRIFSQEESRPNSNELTIREITRWCVPAFGCFLLVMSSLTTRLQEPALDQLAATNLMMTTGDMESSSIYYARNQEHSEKNSIPRTRVEYNISKRIPTLGIGSFLISYTNSLIQ